MCPIALKGFLGALGVDFPSTSLQLLPRTVVLTIVVGTFVTVLSAIAAGPSRRSSFAAGGDARVGGRERRQQSQANPRRADRRRGRRCRHRRQPRRRQLVLLGVGVLLVWVGVLILGPVLALVAAKVIGTPVARAFKVTGKMAQGNAARNPKRTSRAAAPVLIGVALVTAVALLAATLKAQVREIFGEQFVGDYVVKTDDFTGFGGLSPDLADQLNALPEVDAAAGIGVKLAEVDGKVSQITLVDPANGRRGVRPRTSPAARTPT